MPATIPDAARSSAPPPASCPVTSTVPITHRPPLSRVGRSASRSKRRAGSCGGACRDRAENSRKRLTSPIFARLAGCGSICTIADSTLGRGQKTDGANLRTSDTSAKLCTSTDRAENCDVPGWASSRSAISHCTVATIRSIGRSPMSKFAITGVATAYGRLATSLSLVSSEFRLAASSASINRGCNSFLFRSASDWINRTFGRSPTCSSASACTLESISKLTTAPADSAKPRCQAARSRADFEHEIVAAQFRRAHDEIDQIQIDQEALPEFIFRPNAVRRQQPLDMRKSLPRRVET